ncbi:MAG TPA: DNA-processing protein DprA [Negativicutes bacterium]|nr:DNA-processing protein DprA [Negativicutes bacterium]
MAGREKYWLALKMVPGIGGANYRRLLNHFHDPQAVWEAPARLFQQLQDIDQQTRDNLLAYRANADIEAAWQRFLASGMGMITLESADYPPGLANIYNPPPVLFYYGDVHVPKGPVIAIVGSRRCSAYGRHVAGQLAAGLAEAGFTVVSGMARGIDTAAHKGALQGGGYTLAVLGSGADVVYPPENNKLYQEIIQKGAVISEFAPGMPPLAAHFPARNRLISGLSDAVLVIEAAEKSGALITVDAALEQGREVYAVPGCITNNYSTGCHKLIQQGAKLVASVGDILEDYGISTQDVHKNDSTVITMTLEEQTVLPLLGVMPLGLEELVMKTGWHTSQLLSVLTALEIKGFIESVPGKRYKLTDVKGLRR